jgi:hypothetical protein
MARAKKTDGQQETVVGTEAPVEPRYFVQRQVYAIFEADQPLKHLRETVGNHGMAMTRKLRLPSGELARVHMISANAMRNRYRYAAVFATLRAAGLLEEGVTTDSALRLLFAGGSMTGRGDAGVIRFDYWREVATLFPPLALLGGCSDGHIIPGRCAVEPATVLCEESLRYVPPFARRWLAEEHGLREDADDDAVETKLAQVFRPAPEYVEDWQEVRGDPTRSVELRGLLQPAAQVAVHAQIAAREAAKETDDALAVVEEKGSMLPYTYDRIIQGALLGWRVSGTFDSPIYEDAFFAALEAFIHYGPCVGGGHAHGQGQMRLLKAWGFDVSPVRIETTDALRPRVGEMFRAHVAERKDEIRAFLRRVAA